VNRPSAGLFRRPKQNTPAPRSSLQHPFFLSRVFSRGLPLLGVKLITPRCSGIPHLGALRLFFSFFLAAEPHFPTQGRSSTPTEDRLNVSLGSFSIPLVFLLLMFNVRLACGIASLPPWSKNSSLLFSERFFYPLRSMPYKVNFYSSKGRVPPSQMTPPLSVASRRLLFIEGPSFIDFLWFFNWGDVSFAIFLSKKDSVVICAFLPFAIALLETVSVLRAPDSRVTPALQGFLGVFCGGSGRVLVDLSLVLSFSFFFFRRWIDNSSFF